jgi:hypothetical protein
MRSASRGVLGLYRSLGSARLLEVSGGGGKLKSDHRVLGSAQTGDQLGDIGPQVPDRIQVSAIILPFS